MEELNPKVLGNLLLIQSTIHIMPNEEKIASFLSHGLNKIPGIQSVGLCLRGLVFFGDDKIFEEKKSKCNTCHSCNVFSADPSNNYETNCIFESDKSFTCLQIRTATSLYGFLIVFRSDYELFSMYRPYLENTTNLLALIIENKEQKKKLNLHSDNLEITVKDRTKKLLDEINERKLIEKKLRLREDELTERNRFIETIVNISPNILYIYDIVDKMNIYSNDGVERILGYSVDEIQQMGNQLIPQLMHPEDFSHYLEKTIPKYAEAKDNEVIIHEYRMKDKQGTWHWLNCREIIFKRLPDGSVKQILGVIYDYTEQKQAEESFRESEEKLRQFEKMQAIGQLAGGIAHDFNNQLAGIVGYADILRDEFEPNTELRSYIDNLLLVTKRASDLTSQLLAFARKGKYLSKIININSIIVEVINILYRTIDKRIIISQQLDTQPMKISGDPSQIQNALINLALNARDAMPNGGKLTFKSNITLIDDKNYNKNMDELKHGRYVTISISDTGCGMTTDTQKRIFEPFFTTKEQGKGTGMGLASVYGTIKNHGGTILVESKLNQGTTIKLYLPQTDGKPFSEDNSNENNKNYNGKEQILLIDDEEIIIDITSTILKKSGYSVYCCRNGAEAIEYYKENFHFIDLVILDMVMPVMNGNETFLRMKEINPSVCVLLSSGYSYNDEAQKIINNGVKSFIQKPFRRKELIKKISDLLKKTK